MRHSLFVITLFFLLTLTARANDTRSNDTIVATAAYAWVGDTIIQGEYRAWAPSPTHIISTYAAQPGYFMPVDKEWTAKNDLSPYPRLTTGNTLHTAIYNMGLDEMINNVEPDTTLRTGREWAGVWTRDVSYSIILSMAYLQPEAAKVSLRHKVNSRGQIIQDTGSGGAWPISTDRMCWALAAFEVYKVTGDREWLAYIYPIIKNSFEKDFVTTYTADNLVHGETSFIDWREQSYPRWMQTADIYNSCALSTSVVHAASLNVLSQIATILGDKTAATQYGEKAKSLISAINSHFWIEDKGYYAMYDYGRKYKMLNRRAETLGLSLAILFDIADTQRARTITEHNPTTPFGAAIFYPQIADIRPYHNNALWPFVASYWALANAKVGNERGTLEAIGSVFRPAALFATNKENFVLDNGDIATELNSSNMLWSLAGNLAITYRILFGINFEPDGLSFAPVVPKTMAGERTLTNFKYRKADLTITVRGHGNQIKEFTVDGKRRSQPCIDAKLKGRHTIVITLADNDFESMAVNHTANVKAPLTPRTWFEHDPNRKAFGVPLMNTLRWQPIEYAAFYEVWRNGKIVAETRCTEYEATVSGEYQVVAFNEDSTPSFASEPLSNSARYTFEFENEVTEMSSPEVSYKPRHTIAGWHGKGFVETDHNTPMPSIDISVKESGRYAITLIYANGNGPVNTENKCAVRTLNLDGSKAGTLVMPHRGVANWDDWGQSNSVIVNLAAGTKHVLTFPMNSCDENMNLTTNHAIVDRVIVERVEYDY